MTEGILGAVVVVAGVTLAASPYLARLTLSVPDRDEPRWRQGRPASPRRRLVVAGVAVLVGSLAGAAAGWSAALPAFLALALVATPLIVIDFETHRLPDRLVYIGFAAAVVGLGGAGIAGHVDDMVRAGVGWTAVYLVFLAMAVASPRSFGRGDVKLGGLIGAYLGWTGWLYIFYGIFGGFLLAMLLSLPLLLSGRLAMKTAIPFGPALIVGPLIVAAFGLVPSGLRIG